MVIIFVQLKNNGQKFCWSFDGRWRYMRRSSERGHPTALPHQRPKLDLLRAQLWIENSYRETKLDVLIYRAATTATAKSWKARAVLACETGSMREGMVTDVNFREWLAKPNGILSLLRVLGWVLFAEKGVDERISMSRGYASRCVKNKSRMRPKGILLLLHCRGCRVATHCLSNPYPTLG